uniref:Uncharacterized protein n=1 Tax=Romanomermis culicivorax TaxID=13658 RepID=A0A915J2G9_ROMCU
MINVWVRLEIKPSVTAADRSQPSAGGVLDGDRLALLLEQTANARRSDSSFRGTRRRDSVVRKSKQVYKNRLIANSNKEC